MSARADRDAQIMVQGIMDSCADTGMDVRDPLRILRSHYATMQVLRESTARDMNKHPDPIDSAFARAVVREADRVLLELERPKAEA